MNSVGVSSDSNNDVGSIIEIDTSGNLGDTIVCLGALSITAISPACFQLNIMIPTFSTTSHNYSTPVSFVVWVG